MPADISIFSVPYDSGHYRRRMGKGPEAFLAGGLENRLAARGHTVRVSTIQSAAAFPTELASAFDLSRQLAIAIRERPPSFPLTLSGNCIATCGALAGLDTDGMALLWLDAHGDFNTPESTRSGFVDGMALAAVCGHALTSLASGIPGCRPLPATRAALVGARNFDSGERERFQAAGGRWFEQLHGHQDASAIVTHLRHHGSRLYVHLDLDVLDPSEGVANDYAVPGGLSCTGLVALFEECRTRFDIAGATVSAFDPDADARGRVRDIGIELIHSLLT
jgi:arginase